MSYQKRNDLSAIGVAKICMSSVVSGFFWTLFKINGLQDLIYF